MKIHICQKTGTIPELNPEFPWAKNRLAMLAVFVIPTGLKKNISHQNMVQQNGNQQRTKVTITTKSEAVSRTSSALIFRSFSRLRLAAKSSACDGKEIWIWIRWAIFDSWD